MIFESKAGLHRPGSPFPLNSFPTWRTSSSPTPWKSYSAQRPTIGLPSTARPGLIYFPCARSPCHRPSKPSTHCLSGRAYRPGGARGDSGSNGELIPMKTLTRRQFLNRSLTAGLAVGLHRIVIAAEDSSRASSPNDTVRVAVLGLGSTTAVGGVGGRGHQLIPRVREVPGARIVALCDVDQAHLHREAQPFKDRNESVALHRDLRRVLDDKPIDAVVVALPNHWHALATIWACQAGKDAYVEKPFSYNLWEGQQIVAAARE